MRERKNQTGFCKEIGGIYRLRIPFQELYTSVFLIRGENENILVDCATTDNDVDEYIMPALAELGVEPCDIHVIVITHNHSDHVGGLAKILTYIPDARVVRATGEISHSVRVYPMAGHTADCVGVLDLGSRTLISGDSLQGAGVGRYRTAVHDVRAYLESVEKAECDDRIENLLFSHEYEPWYRDGVFGRENVLSVLRDCTEYVKNRI